MQIQQAGVTVGQHSPGLLGQIQLKQRKKREHQEDKSFELVRLLVAVDNILY